MGGGIKSQTVTYNNWPLAHLFPPHMLVMVGFYFAGKGEGGESEYYDR